MPNMLDESELYTESMRKCWKLAKVKERCSPRLAVWSWSGVSVEACECAEA